MKHSPAFLKIVEDAKTRVKELSIAQVRTKLDAGERFHFIDVREDHEWTKGRCKGSTHLGRGILERDVETAVPDKGAEIVLYCGGGFRSALSADNLQKMGYTNVWSMDGGFRGWVEAGGPVESA
ncbi:MAG: sulfurtransferase [Elusimicrobia bacterium]|nr:sulfurtransferase [Elusimicrobiota bacterium]